MAYGVRIGPHPLSSGGRGWSYIALVDREGWQGVEASATAADDESGLRALVEQLGSENLVCAPALAEAAGRLGLRVGEPLDPDTVETWQHGIALSMVISTRLDHTVDPDAATDYALSCSLFENALAAFEDCRIPMVTFSLRSQEILDGPTAGFLVWSEDKVVLSLFPSAAEMERARRMISAEMAIEAIERVGLFGVYRDDHQAEFLHDAMEWASLEHFYIPMKAANGAPCKISRQELMFISATLDAFGELKGGERATGCAVWADDSVKVDLELLPDEDVPLVPPGGAMA